MNGFEWKDQRGIEGLGFFSAIRTRLTAQLPELVPHLSNAIFIQFERELGNAQSRNGWKSISILDMTRRLVARTSCSAFFPSDLCKNCCTSIKRN
jgi:hypothetical protein